MSDTREQFRRAMRRFATGITVITVEETGGRIHGMTANSFTSVSLDPLLVLVCVDQRARTHIHLHTCQRFGINVLAENQRAISEYYARGEETHQQPELAGAAFDRTPRGTPMLRDAMAYFECRLHSSHSVGDHTIFIGEVEDALTRQGDPLLYFDGRYKSLGRDIPVPSAATVL